MYICGHKYCAMEDADEAPVFESAISFQERRQVLILQVRTSDPEVGIVSSTNRRQLRNSVTKICRNYLLSVKIIYCSCQRDLKLEDCPGSFMNTPKGVWRYCD